MSIRVTMGKPRSPHRVHGKLQGAIMQFDELSDIMPYTMVFQDAA